MNIDKNQIIDLLRQRGANSEADQAQTELPDQVDPVEHSNLLSKFGIDPQDLIAKFTGGGSGGGVGDVAGKLGGLLGGKD